jgi:hypothetical protein
MNAEPKIKPDTYEILEFKEGLLRILEESNVPNFKSRLEFGKSKTGYQQGYAYLVYLEDLKNLKQYTFPWRFKRVNDYTMVRRTLSLGLQVMRTKAMQSVFTDTATFSRREYHLMRKYI